jgi:predicted lipoprotein with Yx(FWY)xxD motif
VRRRRARRLPVLVVAALAVTPVTACDDGPATAPTATTAPDDPPTTTSARRPPDLTAVPGTTAPPRPTQVTTASSVLGPILVDGEGRTLYVLLTGTCTGACLDAWPPLTAPVGLEAGPALDAAALVVETGPDGDPRVTYGGRPLYRFGGDVAAGELTGQGVNGVWFVVDPTANPITTTMRD